MHRLPSFRLSALRLPDLRLPTPRVPRLRELRRLPRPSVRIGRPRVDYDDPRGFTEPLRFFFYVCMLVALLAFFSGAIAAGVLLLIAGAGLHVIRSSLEEVAAKRAARRQRGERKRQVRLREHRARQAARPAGQPVVEPAPAEPIRVSAAPRLTARRESAAAGRRRQRVV